MDTADVDYELPLEAIAQTPLEPRDAARLLIDDGPGADPRHGRITDLPSLVRPGDVVVVNTTRVLPARLELTKPTGGAVEVLLLEPLDADERTWEALVRPSRRVAPGTRLEVGEDLTVVVGEDLGEGRRIVDVDLAAGHDLLGALGRHGAIPFPPYISEPLADPERYQTTYADNPGSVAAPTAGLHLTPEVLTGVRDAGATVLPVELVVGLGTFRPITAAKVDDHQMHAERYRVPESTMTACRAAERVVAIGTTTVRALESAAATGDLEGRTQLFIHGDRPFQVVGALVTNFHQPRSSLLVLVEAFIGPRWRGLYDEALREGYRFLSFGDAMFLHQERG
ncbi:MAG: tRNA preQ1(34) S-adenosylmethionine ribosyltransferase-isomerase QueA [Acidimicrobiales bacterium]